MEYMTIKEAAEKWRLSVRRVQTMCNEGMIEGVVKFGHAWAIPNDAQRPIDKRVKSGKYKKIINNTIFEVNQDDRSRSEKTKG